MKTKGEILQKLKQVRYRHLKKGIRKSLSRQPHNCTFNRKIDSILGHRGRAREGHSGSRREAQASSRSREAARAKAKGKARSNAKAKTSGAAKKRESSRQGEHTGERRRGTRTSRAGSESARDTSPLSVDMAAGGAK